MRSRLSCRMRNPQHAAPQPDACGNFPFSTRDRFRGNSLIFGVPASELLLLGRESWRVADNLPGRAAMIVYGFMVGLGASLIGISGGSISNMILTLHGISMHRAVATSAGLGVPITLAGTIGYMLAGLPQRA